MRWLLAAILLLSLMVALPSGRSAEPGRDPLVDKVGKAIQEGIGYLRLHKTLTTAKDGTELLHWENEIQAKGHPGGWSSLALLALLNSGVPPNDPDVQRGLNYLRTIEPSRTYVFGLQTMVFALAGQAVDRQRIQTNVDWLVKTKKAKGWIYGPFVGDGATADNSNTQYALLGLEAGLQADARVDLDVLKSLQRFYVETQVGGGWRYRTGERNPTLTMTTAGVCGLVITNAFLPLGQQVPGTDRAISDGLDWIGQRFPDKLDAQTFEGLGTPFYCLECIERLGRLTGRRFLGGTDWYRVGCEYLVTVQQRDGSWENKVGQLDHHPIVATSFALLFLSRGRTSVLLTKFAHGEGDDWNNKQNDARNLVAFASKKVFQKHPLAWQVFDVRKSAAEDKASLRQLAAQLQSSPLVYLSGHTLRLNAKETFILSEYLNKGGVLFAEPCCGDRQFEKDFKDFMLELFPKDSLRPLPADHPIWQKAGPFKIDPGEFPLWGIEHERRWVVTYSPKPLAGYWEGNQYHRDQGETAFRLGANVLAYVTNGKPPKR